MGPTTTAAAAPAPAADVKLTSSPNHKIEVEELRDAILNKLTYEVGKSQRDANKRDWYFATAMAVRDRVVDQWMTSTTINYARDKRRVYYLSMEFLIGRLLTDTLSNLRIRDTMRVALASLGVDLEALAQIEPDAALGNGGLGRLAACYMESMATVGIAAHGYGIRYDNGLFSQRIRDGWQLEYPEDWLVFGNPWEFPRPERTYPVGFGGHITAATTPEGKTRHVWQPAENVDAVAYDTPVVGWRGKNVNTLRLWSARSREVLHLEAFNNGDYIGALAERMRAESISKVLYPSDATPAGQELRLRQEYFFASASLQDLVRRHLKQHGDVGTLADKVAIQLNDTHPAIAVPEMMRILVDVYNVDWADAWTATKAIFSYTNHTLLPEALETWPVPLMERLLPRHMQIIYLINAVQLDELRERGTEDPRLLSAISLIDEHDGRRVRMGNLAFIGSHKVNGVSALHSDLMTQTVFRDLGQIYPGRITNKTNGITFRRWLFEANPGLTKLAIECCGERVLDDPMALREMDRLADDAAFQERYVAMRRANKEALAKIILERLEIRVDPNALFDIQIKRIHEYKRQLLNILQTIALYEAMRANPHGGWVPRVKIIAGKAAPSYTVAKLIIKLANDVARVVNSDPTVRDMLKVAFLPNYNVSLAEAIIPAADLSEQISTAGMEASGTGNMKLALNGSLTIGTLDGANVEISEHVGLDNIFIFGLKSPEVAELRVRGYDARATIAGSHALRETLETVASGVFSPDDPQRYRQLVDMLTYNDHFLVTADFDSYAETQRKVAARWRDPKEWWKAAIHNTARMGWFSSDRAIREYADEIWKVPVGPSGTG